MANEIITPEQAEKEKAERIARNPPTYSDYDKTMEAYLYDTRSARGYTDREPTDYAASSVPRWHQDAIDWADFRDRVMTYALQVLNDFSAGLPVPSLSEFKAELEEIKCNWTYEITEEQA